MPMDPPLLDAARAAAARVAEIEAVARDRDAWEREIARLQAEYQAAERRVEESSTLEARTEAEASAMRGLLGAVRDRLTGGNAAGRDQRRAAQEEAARAARTWREREEAELRKFERELEEARRRLIAADAALGQRAAARLAARKEFAQLAGAGPTEIERMAAELAGLERKCDAWRLAQKAATARRDHAQAALEQLLAFEKAWPAATNRVQDVAAGDAGPPPPAALDALRRLRSELYQGARAGVGALTQGPLGEIAAITAHEIDRPESVRYVAAHLTQAIEDLQPIVGTTAANLRDLENNLATADDACERLRVRIHERLIATSTRTGER